MNATEAPLLLGRICSAWRAISYATPRLWSALHIVEPTFHEHAGAAFEEKLLQRLEATKAWLGRSGRRPLSISLHSTFSRTTVLSTTPSSRLMEALLPFASRWEHVAFTVPFSILATAAHLTEKDVPMLKSVRIDENHEPGFTNPWESLGFLHGPSIHAAHLAGNSFPPTKLPLRWGGLTDLTISVGSSANWVAASNTLTSEMTLQVFLWCPQLRAFRLRVGDIPGTESGFGESVLELSLRTLDLECRTPSLTLGRLFRRLFLPQMLALRLQGEFMDKGAARPTIYAPLIAAAPRLERLEISLELLSKSSLVYLLHELPSTLREIQISRYTRDAAAGDNHILDDEVLECLIAPPDFPATRCRGLQVLEMRNSYCFFSDKTLLSFLESRPTLKRVSLSFRRAKEVDVGAKLQPSIRNGLQLDLKYLPPVVLHCSPWEGLPGLCLE
ncbi:hypothetical protein B0H15DRAFT_837055 [Mycena belliarum]|uniref:F-box domain-containing protein n=1 Tax=Mycena belliarum TaxID=1033014 RepID=A0AAD6U5K4_9AGAR|nr:hypothetical protein B0H15DRAFT_837055 [Mycena belliae]